MPISFNSDTSSTNVISYPYSGNFNNLKISSNILVNVLSFYPSFTYNNSYSSNYISSNIIANVLTPYSSYNYINNLSSNFISSNIVPNIIAQLVNYNYSSNFSSNFATYKYTSNLTSNLISSNIIPNIIAQLVNYNYSSNFSSNLASYIYTSNLSSNLISSNIINNILLYYPSASITPNYTYLNNYTSNYISSNVLTNVLSFYSSASIYPSYGYINNYSSNFLPLSGGTITGSSTFNNTVSIGSTLSLANNIWNISADGVYRHYYGTNGISYYCCGAGTTGHVFYNNAYANIINIYNNGNVGVGTAAPNTKLDINGVINISSGTTNTPQLGSYGGTGDRIVFWPGNSTNYSFSMGINSGTLWYSVPSGASHKFYNNGVNSLTIDNNYYTFTNGLRLNGADTTNTIYNGSTDMSITVNSGNTINLGMNGGNGTILSINNTSATISQPTTINNTLTIYPNTSTLDGINLYCYPNYISNFNGTNASVNLNVVCNTTATPAKSTFLNATVADGWNGIDTIITLSCGSGANSGWYNASRIILDGSYSGNSSKSNYGSTMRFQSETSSSLWQDNMILQTTSSGSTITTGLYVYGSIYYYGSLTNLSDANVKTNIQPITNALDKISQLQGVYYTLSLDNSSNIGLIAQDVLPIIPEIVKDFIDDKGNDYKGVCYQDLVAVLIEGIKEQQNQINTLTSNIINLQNILISSNIIN